MILEREKAEQEADYYSLGMILYEMMIGQKLFSDYFRLKENELIEFLLSH